MLLIFTIFSLISAIFADHLIGDYAKTPFGYIHKDCVYGVPSGSEIINEGDDGIIVKTPNGATIQYDVCPHSMNQTEIREKLGLSATGSGWQVYTKMNAGDSVTSFLGDWKVPASPTRTGQILYTFTGLQNIDWVPPEQDPDGPFDIIQPVLQYGRTPAGGGSYWAVASWYVTLKAGAIHSGLIRVESGDTIFGNMTKIGSDSWFINGIDTRTQENATIVVTKPILESQPWIYVTLEVYDVDNCDQYPPPGTQMPYSNLTLFESNSNTPVTIDWTVGTDGQQPPVCDATIKVVDANDVTITF